MRLRWSVVVAAATMSGPLLVQPAHAQEACTYSLRLESGDRAASAQATPPTGYTTATQPTADVPPGSGSSHYATLSTADAGCSVAGVAVQLVARDAGQSGFTTVRSGRTNSSGQVFFTEVKPVRTTVLRAQAITPDGQAVVTRDLVERRRTAVSATYQRAGSCVLTARGSTYPAKPGHPVYLQVAEGAGYRTVARSAADPAGRYLVRWTAPCGSHDLVVTVPASVTNTAGRTLYLRQDVTAEG